MSETDTKSKLFRKVALDRLSSPEQLDMLMRVVTPKAWLALVSLLLLILGAIFWGWFGSLPDKIIANKCVLLNSIGLAVVTSESNGRIVDFTVKVGYMVEKGSEVARIAQPDLIDRIRQAEIYVHELEAQEKVVNSFASQGVALTQQTIVQKKQVFESQIVAAQGRVKNAQERARLALERLTVQGELYEQGLVTNQSVMAVREGATNARQDAVSASLEVKNLQNQIDQLKLTRLERDKQGRSEIASIRMQLNEAQRQLDSLVQTEKVSTVVISQYSGRVTEIKARNGMLVDRGTPVITIERDDLNKAHLEAVIYLPVGDGRRVLPQMLAQIVPSTVKREEDGFIWANIRQVSDYPVTKASMMLLMQNEGLVRDLSGITPPTEIRATLIEAESPSGYKWSSAKGPSITIASGTICDAQITIRRQRPLSLVVPILKKTLGID
jgi:HlyD family secretion protein